MEGIILWLFFGLLLAAFAFPVAESKGLSGGAWSLLCIFFGPVAFWALTAHRGDSIALIRQRILGGKLKVCPACAETMRIPAKVCPHCRSEQPAPPAGTPAQP